MKTGEKVMLRNNPIKIARTNAELLNTVYGTNYKSWMRAAYHQSTSKKTMAWMATIDGRVRNGWKNVFNSSYNTIIEEYIGTKVINPPNLYEGTEYTTRAVFQKMRDSSGQYYIFRGMFELSLESNEYKRILVKKSDEWHR